MRAAMPAPAMPHHLHPAPYTGRFAPSPTGPLHAGSLLAALASWLDARAHGGTWLLRIEDVDAPRCKREWGEQIVQQLAAHGLLADGAVLWQSTRLAAYNAALANLQQRGLIYRCTCSRQQIQEALAAQGWQKERHGELRYPSTCRDVQHEFDETQPLTQAFAWRLHVARAAQSLNLNSAQINWHDGQLGPQTQDVAETVGDFVLQRADGCTSYQLAVVLDDAAQGVSHVVRGADLLDNTARQILLQKVLGLPQPHYRHTPLVLAADGQKLSKQNGALSLPYHDASVVAQNLRLAAEGLGLPPAPTALQTPDLLLQHYTQAWRRLYLGKRGS